MGLWIDGTVAALRGRLTMGLGSPWEVARFSRKPFVPTMALRTARRADTPRTRLKGDAVACGFEPPRRAYALITPREVLGHRESDSGFPQDNLLSRHCWGKALIVRHELFVFVHPGAYHVRHAPALMCSVVLQRRLRACGSDMDPASLAHMEGRQQTVREARRS